MAHRWRGQLLAVHAIGAADPILWRLRGLVGRRAWLEQNLFGRCGGDAIAGGRHLGALAGLGHGPFWPAGHDPLGGRCLCHRVCGFVPNRIHLWVLCQCPHLGGGGQLVWLLSAHRGHHPLVRAPTRTRFVLAQLGAGAGRLGGAVGGVVHAQLWLARHGHGIGGGGFGDWHSLGRGDPGSTRGHGFDGGWRAQTPSLDRPRCRSPGQHRCGVHRAASLAHPGVLAAGFGPRRGLVGGHRGQCACHQPHERGPGLYRGRGRVVHFVDDRGAGHRCAVRGLDGRQIRQAARGGHLHADARQWFAAADLCHPFG